MLTIHFLQAMTRDLMTYLPACMSHRIQLKRCKWIHCQASWAPKTCQIYRIHLDRRKIIRPKPSHFSTSNVSNRLLQNLMVLNFLTTALTSNKESQPISIILDIRILKQLVTRKLRIIQTRLYLVLLQVRFTNFINKKVWARTKIIWN